MGRKGVMKRVTQWVCTHSLKLSNATDLFYLFSKCNKTWMPPVWWRTQWVERPMDKSVGTRSKLMRHRKRGNIKKE